MRLTAAPCQQLRYGLTEGGTVAIDAPDPLQTRVTRMHCGAPFRLPTYSGGCGMISCGMSSIERGDR